MQRSTTQHTRARAEPRPILDKTSCLCSRVRVSLIVSCSVRRSDLPSSSRQKLAAFAAKAHTLPSHATPASKL
eukprot:12892025-Prorocentrum_lima.AAC.1